MARLYFFQDALKESQLTNLTEDDVRKMIHEYAQLPFNYKQIQEFAHNITATYTVMTMSEQRLLLSVAQGGRRPPRKTSIGLDLSGRKRNFDRVSEFQTSWTRKIC